MGRRKANRSHSSFRQVAPNPARSAKSFRSMRDHCVYCGKEILWEEAVTPNGKRPTAADELLACPECAEENQSRKRRGERAASQFNIDDLLE